MKPPPLRDALDAHAPRTPATEPPPEPDEAPGPVDPDSGAPDDSVESPDPPRQPGKPGPMVVGRARQWSEPACAARAMT